MPLNLYLYNTLTRRKELFEPIDKNNVRLYVCGPTVYDLAHIGNARPVIVFDVLYRILRKIYSAAHVRYARNITDVDDKINAAAQANGQGIHDLTERTVKAFHQDAAALGCLVPDVEPRATEHIAPMIAMTEKLIATGNAYIAAPPGPPTKAGQGKEGIHVLFSIKSKDDYGKLSRRDRDEMIAGARVEIAPYKRDAADFVLWKPSPVDLPGWDSPWGRGRPGWHLECSAMSEAHLGESFDIHGGGLDLIFPHHENEIAQSECAHGGKRFVKYWLHNGFVTVDGEKMAKSAGNFRTIRDVLDAAPGEAARYAMLTAHYRDPLDWTDERLSQAKLILDRFYLALRGVDDIEPQENEMPMGVGLALGNDLNTPMALGALHQYLRMLNMAATRDEKARQKGNLLLGGRILGLLQQNPETWLQGAGDESREIEAQIAARNAARRNKDFAGADRIRNALAARGIVLEDGPGGTTWRMVR